MTNTELLEQYIRDSGLKKAKLADALGLTYAGFAKKVSGQTEFKASEISILSTMLGISNGEDRDRVFFAQMCD
jgi:hypothetical protein